MCYDNRFYATRLTTGVSTTPLSHPLTFGNTFLITRQCIGDSSHHIFITRVTKGRHTRLHISKIGSPPTELSQGSSLYTVAISYEHDFSHRSLVFQMVSDSNPHGNFYPFTEKRCSFALRHFFTDPCLKSSFHTHSFRPHVSI